MGGSHPIILRGAQACRPEVKHGQRYHMLKVFDLAVGRFPIQKTENGPDDGFRIGFALTISHHVVADYGNEVISVAQRQRLSGGMPVFKIESPNKHRKLLANVYCISDGKVIA